jgi:hypothetical protein
MGVTKRMMIGVLMGAGLSVLAVVLAGAGHGPYAPMAFNASALMFSPGVGIILAVFAAPLFGSAYYAFIPRIQNRHVRGGTAASLLLLHTVPAVWLASSDPAFHDALHLVPGFLCAHFIMALAAVVLLLTFSRRSDEAKC